MTTHRNGDSVRPAGSYSSGERSVENRPIESKYADRRSTREGSVRAAPEPDAGPDAELVDFLAAMEGVAPLAIAEAAPALSAQTSAAALLARRLATEKRRHAAEHDPRIDDPNYLHYRELKLIAAEEVIEYFKEGVQHGVRKKLRRGDYLVQDILDLHRKTVVEARHELFWFLQRSLARELRLVLVSHGKGLHSEQPGRLKSHVAHWLKQIPEVVAYCSALRTGGGTGAVYVLLRKGENERIENRERHGHKGRLDHTR